MAKYKCGKPYFTLLWDLQSIFFGSPNSPAPCPFHAHQAAYPLIQDSWEEQHQVFDQPPADGKSFIFVCSTGHALLREQPQPAGVGGWLWQGGPGERCLCCRWPREGWPPWATPCDGWGAISTGVGLPPALTLCQGTRQAPGLRPFPPPHLQV